MIIPMIKKQPQSIHYQAIFQWFLKIFIAISLIFCIVLIPLMASMKSSFEETQIKQYDQHLQNGASQISSTVTGIINTSKTLSRDSRFVQFRHKNGDYDEIPISTQNQFQETLKALMQPYSSISHIALHLDKKATVTNDAVFFENQLDYYSNFFQVDNLDYDAWISLLNSSPNSFTKACHIKTYSSAYDAILFVTPWANDKYLYGCIKIDDIKALVLAEDNLENCYFTISTTDGDTLYSDLPEDITKYQSFKELGNAGNFSITVHIPDDVFYENLRPFYLFSSLYIIFFICLLVSINIVGTKRAVKPIMQIIDVLEESDHISLKEENTALPEKPQGFDYISNSIIRANQNMMEYQNAIRTQQKILQARFLEKALSGQLVNKNDINNFHAYFPNFPEKYHLFLVKLWSYTQTHYQDPLFLLQTYLGLELPNAYQQQINDSELLLILSAEDYGYACNRLNFMINNINQEEPSYHACCIASNVYTNFEDLPTAYQHLQSMNELPLADYQTQICLADSFHVLDSKNPVTMADLMTLYTAITAGNLELALNRLAAYSNVLSLAENISFARPVYDIIHNMLKYIKLDYSHLLIEQPIPSYQTDMHLYNLLADTVTVFCNQICEYNNVNKDSFTQELLNYIDTHYTDSEICLSSLKTYFKCSESTIRKAFKQITDIPIARYIEQKRMILANELLAQNQKTVTEIALECGYSLPHSFYKAYKRVYGHAPTLSGGVSNIDMEEGDEDEEV